MRESTANLLPTAVPSRHARFLALCALSLLPFWPALRSLLHLSLADDRYSHLVFIPLISAAVAFISRKRIFREPRYAPGIALPALLLCSIGAFLPARGLSLSIAALVGLWIAAFVLCYGPRSLKAAAFPALFLLLAIPIPVGVVEKVSVALQAGSAEIAHGLFKLLGIPVFRQGFAFSLPGVNIEVAEECSGIRSSIALVITAILAGHVFLRSHWTKVSLVVFAAFVAIFKNAVRIVFLSSMTAYSSQDFLNSRLHHQYGGLAFSCLALAMIVPFIFLLRKSEGRTS